MVLAHDIKTVERTQDIHIGVDVNFESMLLKKKTLKGLEISGFYKPSPVQLHGIPLGKCGFDLFLEAKSGTGKTAVFTVISLEKLDLQKDLQTIILAPTREIAAQICDVIKQIGSMYKGLNVEVVMGGLPIGEDIEKFQKKVHILVGSPGRMRHLIQEKHVNVSAVRLLVLDEADKLMDKSFQSDINYIFSVLPKQKQVIMSSATYPESLKSVMQNYVHKVQHICPESNAVLLGINQLVTTVESHPNIVRQTQIKFKELLKILTQREFKQCLIFCNYQIRVVELCKMLLRAKWPAEQLHAQLDQCDRLDALKTLQDYKCRILVSTDLAARGIDASNVDLVINFEPPYEWQTYLHRMGRAGRFGAYGIVITILSVGKEMVKFKEMMRSYSSSLNLVNMWDNNKFELDTHSIWETGNEPEDFCSSPEVTGMGQKIQKKSALSPKSTRCIKDEYDIETFTMLSDCFEKSKECKIESFSDLIASLNVYETDNQEGNEILNTLPETVGEQQFQENGVRLETTRCVSDECGIESFTMLSNSFEKYKECKIESFTDLIDSFKGHEAGSSNKEESEIEDIIFKKSHDLTSKLKSKPKTGIPSHSDTDLEVETVNKSNNILAKNIINEPHNPEEFRIPFTKSYFEAQIKENSSKNKIKKQICPDKIIFDISDSHKALIDAGLPTAFGSTKTIFNQFCQNERTSIKQNYIKNRKLNHLNYEGSGTNVSKDNHRKNGILNEGGYNCHSNTFSRSTKYDRYSKNDTFDRLSKMEYDTGKISPKCYEKYLAWYNHLKSHVKHVEMSIYISELSKN